MTANTENDAASMTSTIFIVIATKPARSADADLGAKSAFPAKVLESLIFAIAMVASQRRFSNQRQMHDKTHLTLFGNLDGAVRIISTPLRRGNDRALHVSRGRRAAIDMLHVHGFVV